MKKLVIDIGIGHRINFKLCDSCSKKYIQQVKKELLERKNKALKESIAWDRNVIKNWINNYNKIKNCKHKFIKIKEWSESVDTATDQSEWIVFKECKYCNCKKEDIDMHYLDFFKRRLGQNLKKL